MYVNKAKTIEEMFKEYVNKIGVSERTIGKEIIFIYSDSILDPNSKENVGNLLRQNSSIIVFDQANKIYLRINLNATNGLKTHMKIERIKSFEDIFIDYANKIGLSDEMFGEESKFVYNDEIYSTKSKMRVGDVLRNKSSITVRFESNKYFTITFDSPSTRLKTIMTIKGTKTINDMLREYGNKVGVKEKRIGKEIIFLYDNKILDAKSKESVENYFEDKSFILNIFSKS